MNEKVRVKRLWFYSDILFLFTPCFKVTGCSGASVEHRVGLTNSSDVLFQRHLTDQEFGGMFGMSPAEFYKLPEWRRNKLKKALHLY